MKLIEMHNLPLQNYNKMSLFVGNISHTTSSRDLHNIFDKFGKNTIDVKGKFAFVDFEVMR